MPIATLNGRSGYITQDQVAQAQALGYTVTSDAGGGGTSTGVGYDPQIGQQQWALTYAEKAAADRAAQATSQYGAETQRYGAQTSRALGAGDLYSKLFGQPENYAAMANLMRGQPNASPLSFWGSLQGLAPLGQSPTFAAMKTLDANRAVSDFFGAAGGGSGSGGGGSSGTYGSSGGGGTYGSSGGGGGGGSGGGGHPGQSEWEARRDAWLGGQSHDAFQMAHGTTAQELNDVVKAKDRAAFEALQQRPAWTPETSHGSNWRAAGEGVNPYRGIGGAATQSTFDYNAAPTLAYHTPTDRSGAPISDGGPSGVPRSGQNQQNQQQQQPSGGGSSGYQASSQAGGGLTREQQHKLDQKAARNRAAGGTDVLPFRGGRRAGTFVATDPTRFMVGPQPFVVGERSKDELVHIGRMADGGTRVVVVPLQNPAVPVDPLVARLANDLVRGSPYRPSVPQPPHPFAYAAWDAGAKGPPNTEPLPALDPDPGGERGDVPVGAYLPHIPGMPAVQGARGYRPITLNDYTGPPIPATRYVLPQLGGAGGSAHGGWTGVYPPAAETAPLSPIGTVPIGPVTIPPDRYGRGHIPAGSHPPLGLAQGGAVVVAPPPTLPPTLDLADRYSAQWGLDDPRVLRALVMAESTGDPNAVGDNGHSIGLLQANMAGGRGRGYTADQLRDPDVNLRIAQAEVTQAYAAGKAQGLAGRDLTRYVAVHAQRPDPTTYDRYSNWYDALANGQAVAPSAGDPSLQAQQPPAAPAVVPVSGVGPVPPAPNPFGALHMAMGGRATVYGTPSEPAVLYRGATPTYATSTPDAAGQVTAPAVSGHGTTRIPYYQGTGFADPTQADPRMVRRLTPLELSLLDSTSRAQHGLSLNNWMAMYQNALPDWQQASTQSAWTRAS